MAYEYPGNAVDPRDLRPRRVWYVVGAALIVCGLVGAVVGFGIGVWRAVALPDFVVEFSDGETATFEITEVDDPQRSWTVYADAPVSMRETDCVVDGPDAHPQLQTSHSHTYETGDQYWGAVGTVQAGTPGTHTITCDSGHDLTYAIGYGDSGFGLFRSVATALLAFGLPLLLGCASGAVVLIVTGVRRNRHDRRLRATPPGPPPASW